MSLAKAVFSGTVYRNPQKRSTSNNVTITSFVLNIGAETEDLIRVVCFGKNAEEIEKTVSQNDKLIVEGNMRLTNIKTETGAEKRILELNLASFEKLSGEKSVDVPTQESDIVKFVPDTEELISDEEIPF